MGQQAASRLQKTIVVLPGDGIGPEVIGAATSVLQDCAARYGHTFALVEMPFGGCAIDRTGAPLPQETLHACRSADAVLLGAVGGPKWDGLPLEKRPESGLLGLRRALGLYINVRPTKPRAALLGISPVKTERLRQCDFEIVRELAGGVYFGAHEIQGEGSAAQARDVASYTAAEIERVARYAFGRAAARGKRLASVDKANVLAVSSLWRATVARLGREYPNVPLEHLYVDNAAMQIVLRPEQFGVMLTSNLFGDILSDEAAALVGSIGLIPSMSRGDSGQGALYEPIHGSAPSLAGKDAACPIGAIFCASMMLRESFGLVGEADGIEQAVDRVLEGGYRTPDIAEPGCRAVGLSEMTSRIRAELAEPRAKSERSGQAS